MSGCAHALGASEYCTLVGGASDADADAELSSSPGAARSSRGEDEPVQASARGQRAAARVREPGCEYRATKAGDLTRHKRTHSGERPYACNKPGCGYKAAEAGSFTAHKRTHSGERPYAFTAHKRTHSGERPYACNEPGCSYKAAGAGTPAKHKRTHSGERPYA
ncbi:hypothetical protein T492DRAFT_895509, partial [Pavlovales sp. CCMP2436]